MKRKIKLAAAFAALVLFCLPVLACGKKPTVATIYTVVFDLNGGTGEAPPQTVEKDGLLSAPETPNKDGYDFSGWFTDKTGGVRWNFETNVVTAGITLYARWAERAENQLPAPVVAIDAYGLATWPAVPHAAGYRVVVNGGAAQSTAETQYRLTPGQRIEVQAVADAGYTDSRFSVAVACPDSLPPAYHYVYYHKSGLPAVRVETGTAPEQPANPTRAGFRFIGWYTDISLQTEFNFGAPIDKNTVVYSKWEKLEQEHFYLVINRTSGYDYAHAIEMTFNKGQSIFNEYLAAVTVDSDDVAAGGLRYIVTDAATEAAVTHRYAAADGGDLTIKNTGRHTVYFSDDNDYNGSGLCAVTGLSAHEKTDTAHVTVYFTDNTFLAADVYAYCYKGSVANKAFPGMKMTYVRNSSSQKKIWSYTIPAGKYEYIIFSDGTSAKQTTKIGLTGKTTGAAFYLDGTTVKEYEYVW